MPKQGSRRKSRTAKQEAYNAKVGKEKETHKELKEVRIQEAAGGYKWEQHGGGLCTYYAYQLPSSTPIEVLEEPFLTMPCLGAADHHCFQCATPLTNPCARSKCFGKHMVVCERFHNTMFKVGAENTCDR